MAQNFCDICGVRPATVRVAVLQNGRQRQLDVCDFHYVQLTRHQRQISPFESLFGSGLGDTPDNDETQVPGTRRRGTRGG